MVKDRRRAVVGFGDVGLYWSEVEGAKRGCLWSGWWSGEDLMIEDGCRDAVGRCSTGVALVGLERGGGC